MIKNNIWVRIILIAAITIVALVLFGCSEDEKLSIFTTISEEITGTDSTVYVSVRLERTVPGPIGSDPELIDDALIMVNGDTLTFRNGLGLFQQQLVDLEKTVTIEVDDDSTLYTHKVSLNRITLGGMPLAENGPIEPYLEVNWNSPDPSWLSTVEIIQLDGTDGYSWSGPSPIQILIPDDYLNDSLRVSFYYSEALPFDENFEQVTYFFTQHSNVLVGDEIN
ncbi:MAG TPA: hypothetical protein ENH10_09575 [Bacteroidetes bacterium]|nr:hypothetical protein [Bacteroidota bacterium]HEX05382.1 hypothetical protein [Bacteroidota bacterium]